MVLSDASPAVTQDGHTSKHTITYKAPTFKLHSFVISVADLEVSVNVIKMLDSVMIWLGNHREPIFNDLSMAMCRYNEVISTKIVGPLVDSSSTNIAVRLSKKLKKQVWVSSNVIFDRFNATLIETGIMMELKNNIEKF